MFVERVISLQGFEARQQENRKGRKIKQYITPSMRRTWVLLQAGSLLSSFACNRANPGRNYGWICGGDYKIGKTVISTSCMTKLYTTDGIFKETRSDRLRGKRLEVHGYFFQNLWVSKEKGCKNTYALMISYFLAKLVLEEWDVHKIRQDRLRSNE